MKKYTKEVRHGQEVLIPSGGTRGSGKVSSRRVWVQCSSSTLRITNQIKGLQSAAWGADPCTDSVQAMFAFLLINECLDGFTTDFKRLAEEYLHFRR